MKKFRKYSWYYFMILPGLIYFIVWHYIPMIGNIVAFKEVPPYAGIQGILSVPWVGLKHFRQFVSSYYFWNILLNSFLISFYKILYGFPAPIILALMLNEVNNSAFKKITQTISYLPHFLSAVIIAGLLTNLLSTNGGIINSIIQLTGHEPVAFLSEPKYFRSVLVASSVWQGVGWESIIYLAAIAGIDPGLYEAATLDGATYFQRIRYITFPSIMSVVSVMFVLKMGGILSTGWEQILLLYSPPVYKVADVIDTYVYREGILGMKYSYTTAVSLFKSVISLIFIVGSNFFAKKMGQEGLW